MKDDEQKQIEEQMRRCLPARLPEQLMARIFTGQSCHQLRPTPQSRNPAGLPGWFEMLRWLAPVAAAVVIFAVWRNEKAAGDKEAPAAPPMAALQANRMQVDQKLVSSFDAVAELPTGEPVRFRVQKWEDDVVLKDKNRGLLVEESAPRWEVVPVRFETY